jgi:hypothetical protein
MVKDMTKSQSVSIRQRTCLQAMLLILAFCLSAHGQAPSRTRTELFFPDLPGSVTLKCDFHMHTVFSDGLVWPTVRVAEAWMEGLDAISITDHIEYNPHTNDIPKHLGRAYEIAKPGADALGLILIRGMEITRGEPPGHWNALFVTNVNELDTPDYHDAVRLAAAQDAFIFWNHPGWKQSNNKSVWYQEQGEALEKGYLQGLEVVNGGDYDAIVHGWCVEKKLTMMGDSDVHDPMGMKVDFAHGDHRPMTLVLARERSAEGIKEALRARRTVIYHKNQLLGEAQYLEPLFQGSIQILNPEPRLKGKGRALVQIHNKSSLDFELVLKEKHADISAPKKLTLPANKTSIMEISALTNTLDEQKTIPLSYSVTNLKTAPKKSLDTQLSLRPIFSSK